MFCCNIEDMPIKTLVYSPEKDVFMTANMLQRFTAACLFLLEENAVNVFPLSMFRHDEK